MLRHFCALILLIGIGPSLMACASPGTASMEACRRFIKPGTDLAHEVANLRRQCSPSTLPDGQAVTTLAATGDKLLVNLSKSAGAGPVSTLPAPATSAPGEPDLSHPSLQVPGFTTRYLGQRLPVELAGETVTAFVFRLDNNSSGVAYACLLAEHGPRRATICRAVLGPNPRELQVRMVAKESVAPDFAAIAR